MTARVYLIIVLIIASLFSCESKIVNKEINNSVLQDSCDNPDAPIECCFVNMPDNLSAKTIIASFNEPGDKLIINGVVYKSDGKTPYGGVLLYVYHTDHTGHYTKKGKESGVQKWHGYLHGWCKTNSEGQYEIQTIRPAPYPNDKIPAHIHCAVKEPDNSKNAQNDTSPPQLLNSTYYINDFVFANDKNVNENYLSSLTLRGGSGIINLVQENDIWKGTRNIILK